MECPVSFTRVSIFMTFSHLKCVERKGKTGSGPWLYCLTLMLRGTNLKAFESWVITAPQAPPPPKYMHREGGKQGEGRLRRYLAPWEAGGVGNGPGWWRGSKGKRENHRRLLCALLSIPCQGCRDLPLSPLPEQRKHNSIFPRQEMK